MATECVDYETQELLLDDASPPPVYIEMTSPPTYDDVVMSEPIVVTVRSRLVTEDQEKFLKFNESPDIPDEINRVVRRTVIRERIKKLNAICKTGDRDEIARVLVSFAVVIPEIVLMIYFSNYFGKWSCVDKKCHPASVGAVIYCMFGTVMIIISFIATQFIWMTVLAKRFFKEVNALMKQYSEEDKDLLSWQYIDGDIYALSASDRPCIEIKLLKPTV